DTGQKRAIVGISAGTDHTFPFTIDIKLADVGGPSAGHDLVTAVLPETVLGLATHYEPPVPPGATVSGVPPRQAPGPLSDAELTLRAKLRQETSHGPERLVPESR
ncbi:hypothetical protein ACVNF4_32075, partial [Streptomyces sp. S6]